MNSARAAQYERGPPSLHDRRVVVLSKIDCGKSCGSVAGEINVGETRPRASCGTEKTFLLELVTKSQSIVEATMWDEIKQPNKLK